MNVCNILTPFSSKNPYILSPVTTSLRPRGIQTKLFNKMGVSDYRQTHVQIGQNDTFEWKSSTFSEKKRKIKKKKK